MKFLIDQNISHRFKKNLFKNSVTLSVIKENGKLKDMRLVQRGNRLSVMPVTKKEFDEILKMEEK